MSQIRKIIHVDMDAFYASVEQRDDPTLRGRPVAVGHPERRGVVAAASYEARRFGVRSAMPSTLALRKCPELVFVPPRFTVYRGVSRQIRAIFEDYTPLVEPLSLDEAYLDVTANERRLPTATATAREIRSRILEATGLTASAGISYNKFLAKLASGRNKPDGQCVIPPGQGAAFVAALEIGRFHGVGPKTAEKMAGLGIATGADLAARDLDWLTRHFGKAGAWYHTVARGEDDRPVVADRPRKSSGSETTFREDLTDPAAIETALADLADEIWSGRSGAALAARTVTVKIRYADFRQVTRARTLPAPLAARAELDAVARDLVRTQFPLRQGVRLLGVALSGFEGGSGIAAPVRVAQLALGL